MGKKTLVFGASLKESRYSFKAIKSLTSNGHDVVAFGLKEGTIFNVKIDTILQTYKNIDTITLYLNPKRQVAYYDYLIGLKPKRILFNPGTENKEFISLLEANNIAYEQACTLVLLATNQY
jgi:hypothetical protein